MTLKKTNGQTHLQSNRNFFIKYSNNFERSCSELYIAINKFLVRYYHNQSE